MVLEEARSDEESSFSETLPSNDVDQYSGDRDPTYLSTRESSYIPVNPPGDHQVYVNTNNLPTPFSFFGQGEYQKILSKAVQDSCRMSSEMLRRPIRQEEADALAYHFSRSMQIGSYGSPVGISLAVLQAYRGRKTYRFPGWQPGEKFNKDSFLIFKGSQARIMWQVLRFNAYAIVGAAVGQIFFGSYALSVGTAGRMTDPRLKELSEKVKEKASRGKSGELMAGNREYDTTAGPREGETLDMSRQRQRAQQPVRQRMQQSGQQRQVDDMSPTGGSFSEEFMDVGGGGADTGIMSDSQAQVSASQKDQEGTRGFGQQRSDEVRRANPRQQSRDDASPMADSAPKQTGSAWERLRQQATSGTQQQSSQRTGSRGERSSGGDSFSFSQSEEDKQLARSEAQKQFDARIEREREGKDFSDQSGGRGGWRS